MIRGRRRAAIAKKALIERLHRCLDATLPTTPTPGRPPQGEDAMKEQLWQECPRCHAEPVCGDCEQCDIHCCCARRAREEKKIMEFEAKNPGLLQKVAEHHEQGAQEH